MNVGERVAVVGKRGLVTRASRSWIRVALDGEDGLPQDYPAAACRRAESHETAPGGRPATQNTPDPAAFCWCGDQLARHAVPCGRTIYTPDSGADHCPEPELAELDGPPGQMSMLL